MSVQRRVLTVALLTGCAVPLAVSATAEAAPSPAPVPAIARSLCAPPADTVGPTASKVSFGRSSISLNSGSRVQPITVTASDTSGSGPTSGVAQVRLEVEGRSFFSGALLKLTSGTPTAGTWTGSITVSKYAHPGTYSIVDLNVEDRARNEQDYPGFDRAPSGPNALSLHPADDPSFAVTGTPAKRPKGKPAGTLADFSLSRTHVNTTAARHHIQVAARFTGAAPRAVSVDLTSAKKSQHIHLVFLDARLHKHHGHWLGSVVVPRWLGVQHLQADLFADFGAGYRPSGRDYSARQLQRRHFASTVAVVSGVDRTPPKVTSLSLSPDPIDSTTGPERVTVTAKATDTGSGVRSITVGGGIDHGINGVAAGAYPYASAGIGFVSSQDFSVRLKQTANGDWVGTTTVKQCVPSGTYKLTAQLRDAADNFHFYSTKQLAQAGITSTVPVTSKHGDVTAPYVYSAATYGADHELFLNFSEGVENVNTSTLSVYPLTPAKSRYTTPIAIASIVCSNGTSTVDCSGSGGVATSAVLTIPGLVPGQKYDVWGNLDQVTPQLTDANGNPLNWNYDTTEVIDS